MAQQHLPEEAPHFQGALGVGRKRGESVSSVVEMVRVVGFFENKGSDFLSRISLSCAPAS